MKVRQQEGGGFAIWCPACKCAHIFDQRWQFNGDFDKPTFIGSMLVQSTLAEPPVTPENLAEYERAPWPQQDVKTVCHSVITDGNIAFAMDCTHAMKGLTLPPGDW